jgi:hypothetical protein
MTVVFKSSQPPSRAEAQQFVESILDWICIKRAD